MKALCWYGPKDVRVEQMPDPEILNPKDGIIKIQASAICGSDLHMYDGYVMGMKKGDILGHEPAGEVVAVGKDVKNTKVGDRVVVPFTISCGSCFYCKNELYSCCDNSNKNAALSAKVLGQPGAALFGYSHPFGGMPGGQAEYLRVPFIDVGALKIPEPMDWEQALFLSDVFPTGYQAAENCQIKSGDTVAVWGCGPVGLFAIASALMLGAERVIAIDRFDYRLKMAQEGAKATDLINYEQQDVQEALLELTGGRGPDACIDAVGSESHGLTLDAAYDNVAQNMRIETDRAHALREAIYACRKGGTVSIPGVYLGIVDKFPLGIAFNKGLSFKMGQTHMQRYMKPLLERIQRGDIDPRFIISHRLTIDEAPWGYKTFCNKEDNCTKVVLRPAA